VPEALPADRVRGIVDAVFRSAPYRDDTQPSLWDYLWDRLLRWILDRLGDFKGLPLASKSVITWTVYAIVLVVLVRLVYAAIQLSRQRWREARGIVSVAASGDAWRAAEQAAATGDYTAAAHAVYAALIQSLATLGILRMHPSKTIGDYVREARASRARHAGRSPSVGSPDGAALLTQFARVYQVVIYRDGVCDAERYAQLREIVAPLTPSPGEASRMMAA
jgi:hypothetical protein